jgi:hypothetical protein
MENLTPEQQIDFLDAEILADEANKLFDDRREEARLMAGALGTAEYGHHYAEFAKADEGFDNVYRAAVVLMPPREAFETSDPIEPFASETVWGAMSQEQKEKASALRAATAEQLAEHGVTEESLRVVMKETEEGEKTFTLIHTGNGIDIGDHSKEYDKARSYNAVMSKKNKDLFSVEVNGRTYDLRSGMTASAYDALVEDCRLREVTLPDSQDAAKEANDDWTWTMLTGEPLTADGYVRLRGVSDGRVRRDVYRPGFDDRYLRVRLAVEIE